MADEATKTDEKPIKTDEEIQAEVINYLSNKLFEEQRTYERQAREIENNPSSRSRVRDEQVRRWSRIFVEESRRIIFLLDADPIRTTQDWKDSFNAALSGSLADGAVPGVHSVVERARDIADLAYQLTHGPSRPSRMPKPGTD